MSEQCSAHQVAEAVCIWSYGPYPIECSEFEDIEDFKCLDLFFSTMIVFKDAFRKEMQESFEEFLEQTSISKKSFIDFLKPRALLLTEKNGCFDVVLVCTYFSRMLGSRRFSHGCFHLARVAYKLLTRILEDRFSEIFETESGWENLILYCRNIHAAVYPLKENRPPGYVPYLTRLIENIHANKNNEQETLENDAESNDMFIAELLGLTPGKEESSDASSLGDDPSSLGDDPSSLGDDPSSLGDDPSHGDSITNNETYWNYFSLDHRIFCEKITQNEEHLKAVYNLLEKLKQDVDTKYASANEFEVSISDDEYIEQLEKEDKFARFSDFMKKKCAEKICREQNARSGATLCQDKVRPEDITDDQIHEFIIKEYYDDPQCDICDGKMRSFTKNWEESFREKYSN